MRLSTDQMNPRRAGVALATALLALLAACQPSGAERAGGIAEAASTNETAAMIPTPPNTPASATPATPRPGPVTAPTIGGIPGTLSIAIGEELLLEGDTRLRLLRIVNDSRCPKDVQCVWAGEVTLGFELVSAAGTDGFELSQSTRPRASVQSIEFELAGFGACPSGRGKSASAECATVSVSRPALL
jgi:hypothetical protein